MKKHTLVYSTNPRVHAKMCELQGRRNRLHTPIVSGTKVGKSYEAMIVCEKVNQASKTALFEGQYKGCRHIGRRKKSMHLSTLKQMYNHIG